MKVDIRPEEREVLSLLLDFALKKHLADGHVVDRLVKKISRKCDKKVINFTEEKNEENGKK